MMFPFPVVHRCFTALRPTFVADPSVDPALPLCGLHIDDGGRGSRYCLPRRLLEQVGWVFRVKVTLVSELVK